MMGKVRIALNAIFIMTNVLKNALIQQFKMIRILFVLNRNLNKKNI